jgi:hypothetical protein
LAHPSTAPLCLERRSAASASSWHHRCDSCYGGARRGRAHYSMSTNPHTAFLLALSPSPPVRFSCSDGPGFDGPGFDRLFRGYPSSCRVAAAVLDRHSCRAAAAVLDRLCCGRGDRRASSCRRTVAVLAHCFHHCCHGCRSRRRCRRYCRCRYYHRQWCGERGHEAPVHHCIRIREYAARP